MALSRGMLKTMALPLVLMAVIFALSSIPGRGQDRTLQFLVDLDPQLQNLLHVPLFGLLQVLWLRALAKTGMASRCVVSTGLLICLAYGVFDEVHQMFVPGRYPSLLDVLLNFTGIVLGTLLFLWVWNNNIKSAA